MILMHRVKIFLGAEITEIPRSARSLEPANSMNSYTLNPKSKENKTEAKQHLLAACYIEDIQHNR